MKDETVIKNARQIILSKLNSATNERQKMYDLLCVNLKLLKESQSRLMLVKKAHYYFRVVREFSNPKVSEIDVVFKLKHLIEVEHRKFKDLEQMRKLLICQFKHAQRQESKALLKLRKWDLRNFK